MVAQKPIPVGNIYLQTNTGFRLIIDIL